MAIKLQKSIHFVLDNRAADPHHGTTMTAKAFAYLRVSGKGQIQGDGFPRQLAAIRGYAQAHEIRIVHVFREEGVCGATESADRPGALHLIAPVDCAENLALRNAGGGCPRIAASD